VRTPIFQSLLVRFCSARGFARQQQKPELQVKGYFFSVAKHSPRFLEPTSIALFSAVRPSRKTNAIEPGLLDGFALSTSQRRKQP